VKVYLDANIVIYLVENHPVWGPKALARITQLRASGDQIAVGDASRLECLVGPYILSDPKILADYSAFFQAPDMTVFPLTAAVCEQAARIRATYSVKPLDALHLATAIEHGCGLFLTNDSQLQKCALITVEVLT
jgi:uncharacterized protein